MGKSKQFYLYNVAFILLFLVGAWQFTRVKPHLESDFRAYYMTGLKVVAKVTGMSFNVDKSLNKSGVVDKETPFYDEREATPFKYLPHTAILFSPFSLLPYFIAKKAWYLFTFGCLILSYVLLRNSFLTGLKPKKRMWVELLSVLILYRFYQYDIRNLQINFPILLFLSLFIYLWTQNRKNWSIFFLSLAVSIKIFPIIAFIPFLIQKRIKPLLTAALFALLFLLFPLVYGENIITLYKSFFAFLNNGQHEYPASANYIFASIDSLFVRIFMDKPFHHNFSLSILNLSGDVVAIIINIFKAALILLASFEIYRKKVNLINAVVLMFSISLVLNPLAWKHAFVSLLPLILLSLSNFRTYPHPKLVVAAIILLACTTKLFFGSYQPHVQAIGAIPIAVIFLSFNLLFKRN